MNEQIINDFWKEKIILIQRQNQRLSKQIENLSETKEKIQKMQEKFYNYKFESEFNENSISSSITILNNFQLRLFIQHQTKLSFMEKTLSGFEKIADVKLFNEPFSQIEHFLFHFEIYKQELENLKDKNQRFQKKMQISEEFLKAVLQKKYKNKKTDFSVNIIEDKFEITLNNSGTQQKKVLKPEEIPFI